MRTRLIRWTSLPGTAALFADFLYEPARTLRFFGRNFRDPSDLRQAAAEIRYPAERRAELVKILAAQNPANPSLATLARPETVAVVTGQQAGLFTGPAYSFYKALTALKLARSLQEQGLPAVPVFWLATEDHDFEEAAQCWVPDASSQPVRICAEFPEFPHGPVGPTPVDSRVVHELSRVLEGLPYADFVLSAAAEAYRPPASFGAAFRELMRRLLPESGLLFLDPLDPALRHLAAPFLIETLRRSADLVGILMERNRELDSAGYHAQVRVDRENTLFFLLRQGRRLPLRSSPAGFHCGGEVFSLDELAARGTELSPNALLRPVLQDYLLPTLALVGGPAEIAYLAQSQALYQRLLGRMPVVFPRAGFTVLDGHSAGLADHYGLSLPDLLAGQDRVQERIAAALVPPELQQRLERTRTEVEDSLQNLRLALAHFDATLACALDTSRRKILYQLWKIQRKASAEAFRRNVRASRQTERLLNLAAPHRHLQERFYCILGLLARFGPSLTQALYQEIDLFCPDHRTLVL